MGKFLVEKVDANDLLKFMRNSKYWFYLYLSFFVDDEEYIKSLKIPEDVYPEFIKSVEFIKNLKNMVKKISSRYLPDKEIIGVSILFDDMLNRVYFKKPDGSVEYFFVGSVIPSTPVWLPEAIEEMIALEEI